MTGKASDKTKAVIQILHPVGDGKEKGGRQAGKKDRLALTRDVLANGNVRAVPAGAEDVSFEVQYNPATLSISQQVRQQGGDGETGSGMEHTVTGNCTRTLEVELVFSREEGMEQDAVQKKVETFLALMLRSTDRRVSFSWGRFSCKGAVTDMSASYDMFDGEGNPLAGCVQLTIQEDVSDRGEAFDRADRTGNNRLRSPGNGEI